jgi:hypothetical protein
MSLALNATCKGDLWADLAVPSFGNCDKVYDATLGDRQSACFRQFDRLAFASLHRIASRMLNNFVGRLGRSHDGTQYFAL